MKADRAIAAAGLDEPLLCATFTVDRYAAPARDGDARLIRSELAAPFDTRPEFAARVEVDGHERRCCRYSVARRVSVHGPAANGDRAERVRNEPAPCAGAGVERLDARRRRSDDRFTLAYGDGIERIRAQNVDASNRCRRSSRAR